MPLSSWVHTGLSQRAFSGDAIGHPGPRRASAIRRYLVHGWIPSGCLEFYYQHCVGLREAQTREGPKDRCLHRVTGRIPRRVEHTIDRNLA